MCVCVCVCVFCFANTLHSVKPVLVDWQSSYRRCRKDEVVLCRARIRPYIYDPFIHPKEGRKEGRIQHILFYGYMASDMVKDHSDSVRGNLLPPHRLLFPINSKGSFICTIPQTG